MKLKDANTENKYSGTTINRPNGITLIALVITIIILTILSAVAINLTLGENGILNKAKEAKNETIKQAATEKMNLKITNMQIDKYAKEQRMPTLQEFADGLCVDNDIEYVELKSKNVANLSKIEIGSADSIFTKLKEYPYEFEINKIGKIELIEIDNLEEKQNSEKDAKESLVMLQHFEHNYGVLTNNSNISTDEKKMGNASLYLNNIEITNTNEAEFGFSSDFTIDYWLKLSEENLSKSWIGNIVVAKTGGIWIGFNSGKFIVRSYNQVNHLEIDAPPIDEWVHIAICRSDGTLYVFYNGILKGQVANNTNFSQGVLHIGSDGSSNYIVNSYMDDLRIINGTAKWTSNFSVPTEEHQDLNSIIYHFNNEEIYENTASLNEMEKKFGDRSIYLNNMDILYKEKEEYKLDSDFTIDYWLKLSEENLSKTWVGNIVVLKTGGIWIGLNSGKFIVRSYNQVNHIEIDAPPTDEWVHIAICRNNGTLYVFYNGILEGQVANTNSFVQGDLCIGSDGPNYMENSYMDELRILNGYCAWTRNFEVPTKEYNYN